MSAVQQPCHDHSTHQRSFSLSTSSGRPSPHSFTMILPETAPLKGNGAQPPPPAYGTPPPPPTFTGPSDDGFYQFVHAPPRYAAAKRFLKAFFVALAVWVLLAAVVGTSVDVVMHMPGRWVRSVPSWAPFNNNNLMCRLLAITILTVACLYTNASTFFPHPHPHHHHKLTSPHPSPFLILCCSLEAESSSTVMWKSWSPLFSVMPRNST